jgi:replication factor A1
LKAKVLEIPEARVVFTKFGQARVTRALIGDETGTIRLALWGEQIESVSINSLIKIENGKAIIFRGERQINVGKNGQMKVIEDDSHAFEKELRTN